METDEFLKIQFEALRQEILSTQKRSLQTLGAGAFGIPVVGYLSTASAELSLALPPMVVCVALLYLADNHGMNRCGEYIKDEIEPRLARDGVVGWETWLEAIGGSRRTTERYTKYGFYTLFIIYFTISIAMAFFYMQAKPGPDSRWVLLGFIVLGCAFALGLIFRSLRERTSSGQATSGYCTKHCFYILVGVFIIFSAFMAFSFLNMPAKSGPNSLWFSLAACLLVYAFALGYHFPSSSERSSSRQAMSTESTVPE